MITIENMLFSRLRNDITEGLNDALERMLKNDVDEGKVTCTIKISIAEKEVAGTQSMARIAKMPFFKHKVNTAVTNGKSIEGGCDPQKEIILTETGELVMRAMPDGQMSLFRVDDDG